MDETLQKSSVVMLTRDELEKGAEGSLEQKKVYYEYVTDTVKENLSAEKVAEKFKWLRERYEQKKLKHPEFDVASFKSKLRRNFPEINRFAAEHPRFFDAVLSHHTTDRDLDVLGQMLKFRAAVESGILTENHAKALLNEILLRHNSRPLGTDREKMADQRLERNVAEGSYLGFDPASIPALREAAAAASAAIKK